jgi:hypothetical protein
MPDAPLPIRWEVQPSLIIGGAVLAVALVGFALFAADPVEDPAATTLPPVTVTIEPERVNGWTSEQLETLRALLQIIAERDDLTPAEQRLVDLGQDVVDSVDDGDVPLAPAPPPSTTSTTTSTTTTQPPPPTTRPAPLIDLNDTLDGLLGDP